jgi:hypothetical protein
MPDPDASLKLGSRWLSAWAEKVRAPKREVAAAAAPKYLQKARRVAVESVFNTVPSKTSLQNEHYLEESLQKIYL